MGEWKIDVIVNYQPPYSKVCANGLENGGLRAARPTNGLTDVLSHV